MYLMHSYVSISPEPWGSKCLVPIAQMVRAFGMNPKDGVRVPLRSRHFLSQNLRSFHKHISSCVENECCCSRTVNISKVNFTTKISPEFNMVTTSWSVWLLQWFWSAKNTWWRHRMETFSALLALCAGNSPVTVNSPHKGQWRGALIFSLICARING